MKLVPLAVTAALWLAVVAHAEQAVGPVTDSGTDSGETQEETSEGALTGESQVVQDTEPTGAEPGVFPDRILLGQSAALSGETEALGRNYRQGILAAFEEAGQVHGRRIELISRDDGYEPAQALTQTRELIEQESVFALIGAVGTPTTRAAAPVALEEDVPFIAPFTGAEFLRAPQWRNVVNLRASYFQEAEEIVRFLVDDLKLDQIAVFYQDDSFGQAGYQGVNLALSKRALEATAITAYPRNTRAVKTGLLEIRDAKPEAVVMVGSYQPVAEIVAWSRHIGFNPVFATLSFAGGNALTEALGSTGDGVYVTQVVPFPWGDDPPVLQQYKRALGAHAPDAEPGFVSLEGYLAGRLTVAALNALGPQVTRQGFMEQVVGGPMNLGGFNLSFDDGNQGSNHVFLTVLDGNGDYRPITNSE